MSSNDMPEVPVVMGRRQDEEMGGLGGLFSLVPQVEALLADFKPIIAAIEPSKIRDFFDAIKVDGNTVEIDVKLILRKTQSP